MTAGPGDPAPRRRGVACAAALLLAGVTCPGQIPSGPPRHDERQAPRPTRRAFSVEGTGAAHVRFDAGLYGHESRRFFAAGIALLHGNAPDEAERAFREAARLEPGAALPWWGAALAAEHDADRAAHFAEEAVLRLPRTGSARARGLIRALATFHEVDADEAAARRAERYEIFELPIRTVRRSAAERHLKMLADLRALAAGAPEDPELALLAVRQAVRCMDRGLATGESPDAWNDLLDRALPGRPRHPAHRYLLRTDLLGRPARALRAASVVGTYAPRVPDQWAACGRAMRRLGRYADAEVYFEAAVRTAHAWLQREQRMPFAVPGYGSFVDDWLGELLRGGRFAEAERWIAHFESQPRHPEWNDPEDPSSPAARVARRREALGVLAGRDGTAGDDPVLGAVLDADSLRHGGIVSEGRGGRGASLREALERVEDALRLDGSQAAVLARAVDLRLRSRDREGALAAFERLRTCGGRADHEAPVFAAAEALAAELGCAGGAWRAPRHPLLDWPRAEIGPRPPTESLGPLGWTPPTPRRWVGVKDPYGLAADLDEFRGRPVVVLLYLGFGCLLCVEQLADFQPTVADFRESGIELVALGTDTPEGTMRSLVDLGRDRYDFPVFSDRKLRVFREWLAFDDFEHMPMHGAYLLDGEGRIRWQDLGDEPFARPAWLLRESARLLRAPVWTAPGDGTGDTGKTRSGSGDD